MWQSHVRKAAMFATQYFTLIMACRMSQDEA